MYNLKKLQVLVAAMVLAGVQAIPRTSLASWHHPKGCPPFEGTFSIENFKFYPENSDWDSIGCKLYAGSNFNATVLVYDPYTTDYEILTFPGISGVDPYHISGVDFDSSTGSMYFTANSGTAFVTNGTELTGPNKLIRWDTRKMEVIYTADLGAFQTQYEQKFGHAIAGFQDQAEDGEGNSYIAASFGGYAIAKVSSCGEVSTFYESGDKAKNLIALPFIYAGVVSLPEHHKIVYSDWQNGTFVTFDTTCSNPQPALVHVSNLPSFYQSIACDAMITPTRYAHQSVLLCSEDFLRNSDDGSSGAITVFVSKDHWHTASYAGVIWNDNPIAKGSFPTATVQIADSIFISEEFFFDAGIYDAPGNRSSFPFVDITAQVDAIVSKAGTEAKEL